MRPTKRTIPTAFWRASADVEFDLGERVDPHAEDVLDDLDGIADSPKAVRQVAAHCIGRCGDEREERFPKDPRAEDDEEDQDPAKEDDEEAQVEGHRIPGGPSSWPVLRLTPPHGVLGDNFALPPPPLPPQ